MNTSNMSYVDISLFRYSIQAILKSWTALQLAVSHSFAGPQSREKAQWLVEVIETFFRENANLDPYEVEEFIEEILSNEFNTLPEDDSAKEVACEICAMYKLWKDGNRIDMRERLAKLPYVNLAQCIAADTTNPESQNEEDEKIINQLNICGPSSNGDNSTSMETDAQNEKSKTNNNLTNSESDDGWIHVVTRKKRHK